MSQYVYLVKRLVDALLNGKVHLFEPRRHLLHEVCLCQIFETAFDVVTHLRKKTKTVSDLVLS